MDDARDERAAAGVRVEVAGPAVDLGVAEAVEREPRLPALPRLRARERVGVRRARRAQGTGVELTVLQHLRGADRDDGAAFTPDADADAPDEVLTEVEDAAPGGRGEHRTGGTSCVQRTGGPVGAARVAGSRRRTATCCQSPASKPASDQPASSRRAS